MIHFKDPQTAPATQLDMKLNCCSPWEPETLLYSTLLKSGEQYRFGGSLSIPLPAVHI